MSVQHPQIHEVALLRPGCCSQHFVDGKIGDVQPVAKLRIGNWFIEFAGKSGRPLQNRGPGHRLRDHALPETRIAAARMHREPGRLKRSAVGLHQIIKRLVVGREDVLVLSEAESVLLDHRAASERTPGIPVAADYRNDVLLELVKRHGRFLP